MLKDIILKLLIDNPICFFNAKDIARETKYSYTDVFNTLKDLKKDKLIDYDYCGAGEIEMIEVVCNS